MGEVNKKLNIRRVIWACGYFILSILLVVILKDKIFYFQVSPNSCNFYRFVWCISSTSLGFSVVAFYFRCKEKPPFPEYLTFYPFLLLAISALVFSALHVFEGTSNYIFYYLSFSLCFTFGVMVDQYLRFIESIIVKAGPKTNSNKNVS